MRRMEEKIRVLVEDLESESKLRRRVEREKQDLQMQVRFLFPLEDLELVRIHLRMRYISNVTIRKHMT